MKIYAILLLLFVVIVAGCSQSAPINTPPVGNEPSTNVPVENTQTNEPTTPAENTQTSSPANNKPIAPVETTPSGISSSELAAHNERTDCWIAYKGKVYDITNFVPIHPGGASKIIPYCGTSSEFEAAFTKKHGTSQVSRMIRETTLMGDLQ